MSGDYANAITAERAAHQRGYLRGGHGAYKMESIEAAHARTCSRIIAQAYRAGDYTGMWRALSKATLQPPSSTAAPTRIVPQLGERRLRACAPAHTS